MSIGAHKPRRTGPAARALTVGAALLLAALLVSSALLGGCAAEGPLEQPPEVDEEALAREAEERRLAEEEAARLAEERRLEAERREAEEMAELFGPVGEPPPVGPLPEPVITGIPFDEAVPPLPDEPTLRVAVFSLASQPDKARQVALVLGTHERERLEARLGMAVKITYVAQTKHPPRHASEVRYRPEFLRAAQSVAAVLAAEQWIGPMTDAERRQEGVDVVVHVGEAYR